MSGRWTWSLMLHRSGGIGGQKVQVLPILSANHIPCVFSSHFQTSSPCKHHTPSFLLYAYKMHIKEYMHIPLCMHTYIHIYIKYMNVFFLNHLGISCRHCVYLPLNTLRSNKVRIFNFDTLLLSNYPKNVLQFGFV